MPGAVLITGALMLAVYTIVEAAEHGWGSAHTLGLGGVAVALLAAFVAREARARTPLMPLRIFRSRNVSGANLIQVLMVAGLFGMFFLGALYMQRVLGYDALEVGLAFLPVASLIGALSLGVSAAADHALRAAADAAPGPCAGRARARAVQPRVPVDGGLRGRRAARRWCCSASAPACRSRR